ncbi:MAG: sulfide/dihydroorotate dehydrogenase-like FAD/NAD-binding protein [Oscillospiraceae bacterium]|nr:sulfide/dihydroorotate dehydrogenase-like FAD/NAD-binding protein [Oscillospiraceae bacterium]
MAKIVRRVSLNPILTLLEVEAPRIAKKALPGQFVILRIDERGERIPLTIAEYNTAAGTATVIFQTAGATTARLAELEAGQDILDFVGPLGKPTEIPEGTKKVCVVGGGVGCAIAYPQAKALHAAGIPVDLIVGFRNKDALFFEEEFKAACDNLFITTDDGGYGEHGLVTDVLKREINNGAGYDLVIAIGPVPMMKFTALATKEYGIKTLVSLNPIMVDGTGMCGGCRVTVGGETKFACVDGPDFDGHQVDFEELTNRNAIYREQEKHACNLTGEVR